jgi:hypothetical protein
MIHPVTRQTINELAARWEQIAPGSTISPLVWMDLLTQFHPQVIQKKLNDIAANRVERSHVGYFKKTFENDNVYLLQTQMGLEPAFVLEDEDVVPVGAKPIPYTRQIERSMADRSILKAVKLEREARNLSPLSTDEIWSEINRCYRAKQGCQIDGTIHFPPIFAHPMVQRLVEK